jgi:hypothetical protein
MARPFGYFALVAVLSDKIMYRWVENANSLMRLINLLSLKFI